MFPKWVNNHSSHGSSMFTLSSSLLALKRKLKLSTTYTILVLFFFFFFTLYITSCEARHLRFDGKYSSNDRPSLSSKDATEVGDTKKQTRDSFIVHDTGKKARVAGRSISNQSTSPGESSVDLTGGIRNTRHVARVLQRLPHRKHSDDQGIHLDYDQPTTSTPYHN